jgi:NAD(P)H dehydrogenase (quinone)
MNMIVVTGATGKLGRLVVQELLQKLPAAELAVAVRSPSKAADFAARGVQVRHADYDRPETLSSAFAEGDQVLLISGNEVGRRAPQHHRVIAAATAAGVRLLGYTSLLRADRSRLALAEEHKATEEAIRASGVPFVFLRNGWYLENYTDQIDGILQRGAIVGAAGNGRVAAATRQDYAAAASAVLTSAGHENAIYELAGDPFTMNGFAAELSRQAGKRIVYTNLPPEQYKEALVGAGLPAAYADLLVDSDLAAADGELDSDSADLQRLIGRAPTTLRDAIGRALKQTTAR